MKTLDAHIAKLLSEHDCVIVPGLGGFVASRKGATLYRARVYPPCKSVGFNAALSHNDGLLVESYMHESALSYIEATARMERDVAGMTAALRSEGSHRITGVGRLVYSDGRCSFEPDTFNRLLPETYGLNTVLCPVLQPRAETAPEPSVADQAPAQETEPQAPKVVPLRQWHRFPAAAAAVAAVLLLLLLPSNTGNGDMQWMQAASTIPLPRLVPEAVVEATMAEASETETEEETVEETPFHLVIGSFKTQHKALQFIKSVPPELQPYILYSDQRYRIAVAAFATETEGEAFLQQFIVARPDYSDAWVLAFQNP